MATGVIRYPDGSVGTLVYTKATVGSHESPDILHYKRTHPAFPHEPTSDQFFDEAQFESYRALGYHVGRGVAEVFLRERQKTPEESHT